MLKWLLLSIPLLALGAYFAGHAVLGPQLAPGNVTSPTTTTPSPIATVTPDTSTTATPTVVTLATGRWPGGVDPATAQAAEAIAHFHGADNRLTFMARIGSGTHPLLVTHRPAPGDFYRHAHPEAHKRRWP